jgi:hypothetical protein
VLRNNRNNNSKAVLAASAALVVTRKRDLVVDSRKRDRPHLSRRQPVVPAAHAMPQVGLAVQALLATLAAQGARMLRAVRVRRVAHASPPVEHADRERPVSDLRQLNYRTVGRPQHTCGRCDVKAAL